MSLLAAASEMLGCAVLYLANLQPWDFRRWERESICGEGGGGRLVVQGPLKVREKETEGGVGCNGVSIDLVILW